MTSERGSAPIELALVVGFLLIPMALLTLSFGPWLERRAMANAAAAEAARLLVVAEPVGSGEEAARSAIIDMAANAGVPTDDVSFVFCPSAGDSCGEISRGEMVTVTVDVEVPAISTPFGPIGGLTLRASHSEPVDLYRSLP